jgi:hypothetical protein
MASHKPAGFAPDVWAEVSRHRARSAEAFSQNVVAPAE